MFSLPEGAQLDGRVGRADFGHAGGAEPARQGQRTKKAIGYPFRPGDSGVRIAYQVPYPNNQAQLTFISPYGADQLAVFAPPSVQVSGDGFAPAGTDTGLQRLHARNGGGEHADCGVGFGDGATAAQQDSGASDNGGNAAAGGDDSQNPSVNSRADSGAATPVANRDDVVPRGSIA